MSVLFPSLPDCSPSAEGHSCPDTVQRWREKLQLEASLCVREKNRMMPPQCSYPTQCWRFSERVIEHALVYLCNML